MDGLDNNALRWLAMQFFIIPPFSHYHSDCQQMVYIRFANKNITILNHFAKHTLAVIKTFKYVLIPVISGLPALVSMTTPPLFNISCNHWQTVNEHFANKPQKYLTFRKMHMHVLHNVDIRFSNTLLFITETHALQCITSYYYIYPIHLPPPHVNLLSYEFSYALVEARSYCHFR